MYFKKYFQTRYSESSISVLQIKQKDFYGRKIFRYNDNISLFPPIMFINYSSARMNFRLFHVIRLEIDTRFSIKEYLGFIPLLNSSNVFWNVLHRIVTLGMRSVE